MDITELLIINKMGNELEKTLGSEKHKKLIQLLIKAREVAGLTQEELAKELGEYQSFIARLESGQRRLDVVEFIKISSVLKIKPNTIIDQL